MNIILKVLGTKATKKILISVLEAMAKQTTNTVDDEIVKVVKNCL